EDGNVMREPRLERQERRDGVAVRDRSRPAGDGAWRTAPSRCQAARFVPALAERTPGDKSESSRPAAGGTALPLSEQGGAATPVLQKGVLSCAFSPRLSLPQNAGVAPRPPRRPTSPVSRDELARWVQSARQLRRSGSPGFARFPHADPHG